MFRFRKRPPAPSLSREAALGLTPVPHQDVLAEDLPGGDVMLVYPLRWRPWMTQLAQRLGGGTSAPPMRRIQLDEMGSRTWRLMDGRRSVREIAHALSGRYRLPREEAEMAVSQFIRELGRRGLVGLR